MWRLSVQVQDLVDRLHHLLSSAPWLDRAKYDESITVLIDQIRDQGEPAALAAVARCLFSPAQHIRIAASGTIHRLLSLVAPDQLIHLSGALGLSWGWYVSDSWDKLTPEGVSALLADAGSRAGVLGLLTFHRNGYVRHEAVRLLADDSGGDELPYLLIRQNDWVSVIGDLAQEAVNKRLSPSYLPHFVRCLPLVVHLLALRRRDLSRVVQQVVEMLVQPPHDAMLAEVIAIARISPIEASRCLESAD